MKTYRLFLLIVFAMTVPCAGFADEPVNVTLTMRYAPVTGGYRYYVTVHNNTLPSENLHVRYFDVKLYPASNLLTPTGWTGYVNTFTERIKWNATGLFGDWTYCVPPATSWSRWEFTTAFLATSVSYVGGAENSIGTGYFVDTTTPTPIPEPSSLVIMLCSLLAGTYLCHRKRLAFKHRL